MARRLALNCADSNNSSRARDLMSGVVQVGIQNAGASLPVVRDGRVRGLAVTSLKRSANAPELPTFAESGYPGFEASVWYGLVAPAATPKPIVSRLHDEVQKALQTKEVKDRMNAVGGEVVETRCRAHRAGGGAGGDT